MKIFTDIYSFALGLLRQYNIYFNVFEQIYIKPNSCSGKKKRFFFLQINNIYVCNFWTLFDIQRISKTIPRYYDNHNHILSHLDNSNNIYITLIYLISGTR